MAINTDNDRLAQTLHFKKIEQREDFGKVEAIAEEPFLNGVNIAHGGFLFSLCDYALALAANTPMRTAISSSAQIEYMNPVAPNTALLAEASLLSGNQKTGYFQVRVFDKQSGQTYCIFHSRAIYKK